LKLRGSRFVISIETELGGKGERIARTLAEKLHIPCYCSEILVEAAKISGISEKLLKRYEEKRVRHAYDLSAMDASSIYLPPSSDFQAAQIAACREIAERENCVLVDHHCGIALADFQDHIRIFIHGSREVRLLNFTSEHHVDPLLMRKIFLKKERQRKKYFRSANPHWGEAKYYDLSVNATHGTLDELADHIVDFLQNKAAEDLLPPYHGARAQRLIKSAEVIYLEDYRKRMAQRKSLSMGKPQNNTEIERD